MIIIRTNYPVKDVDSEKESTNQEKKPRYLNSTICRHESQEQSVTHTIKTKKT